MGKFIKNNDREIHIFDQIDELTDFALQTWKEVAIKACVERGYFAVALSGGKTPIPFFEKLARSISDLPWNKTHIFFVDERFVPLDHKESNYRLIKQYLLDPLHLNNGQVHFIPVELGIPQTAASKYELELKDFFELQPGKVPVFDLILLGLGEDGHTASLFTGFSLEEQKLVIPVEHTPYQRVTMTLNVITQAKNVMFLIVGESKAQIVQSVIQERDKAYPASHVVLRNGKLLFLLDRQAAKELTMEQKRPVIPKLKLSGTSY